MSIFTKILFAGLLSLSLSCTTSPKINFSNSQSGVQDLSECIPIIIQDGKEIVPHIENKLPIYKLKPMSFRVEFKNRRCSPRIGYLSQQSEVDYLLQTPLIFAATGYSVAGDFETADVMAVHAGGNPQTTLDEIIKNTTKDVKWANQQYKKLCAKLSYCPTPAKPYATMWAFLNPTTKTNRGYAEFKRFTKSETMSAASGKIIRAVVYTRDLTASKITKHKNDKVELFYVLKPNIMILDFTSQETKTPSVSVTTSGKITNIFVVDPDLKKQAEVFAEVRRIPNSENTTVIPWIINNANNLQPAFLYELARRLWETDREKALEWYSAGHIRAVYDAMRCVDTSAPQGIAVLPQIAENVAKGIELNRSAYGAAGARALSRSDIFQSNVSPWWICSHGIRSVKSALNNESISQESWLKPESEWEGIRNNLQAELSKVYEEQGRPQDDPIVASKNYQVVDIPVNNADTYVWLNSDQLVIAIDEKKQAKFTEKSLVLWNKDGSRQDLVRTNGAWCAGNGVIAYQSAAEKKDSKLFKLTYMTGTPGQWKETSFTLSVPLLRAHVFEDNSFRSYETNDITQSPFDCRWVKSKLWSGYTRGEQWIPLLPDHGFLLLQKGKDVSYYKDENSQPIVLPINMTNVPVSAIRYYPYKQAYFISPAVSPIEKKQDATTCVKVWWFWPKMLKTEELCVPIDAVNNNIVTYSTSRTGLLRKVTYRKTYHGAKPGGIYLSLSNDKVEKIFEGYVRDWAVSPDGCSVAFRHSSVISSLEYLNPKLSLIELCR